MDNKMGLCCSTEPDIETPTENARMGVAVPPRLSRSLTFYQVYNNLPPPMNFMATIFEEDENEDNLYLYAQQVKIASEHAVTIDKEMENSF
jgi:hypothetical protein